MVHEDTVAVLWNRWNCRRWCSRRTVPELNPAERVFEEVRRWVEGKVYESIEEKMEAVNAYLRRLESDPGRVRSLTEWNWIGEAVQSLPSCHAASSN